jgi:ElaB/YqjD/DUF883 family membrane-anchored ribosome-binding protein
MSLLPDRLVVEDKELQKLANQARKIMEGKTPEDLKNEDKIRTKVRTELAKVEKGLSKAIKDMPARAFDFDDEE